MKNPLSLDDVKLLFSQIQKDIRRLCGRFEEELDNVKIDENNLDEDFLKRQFKWCYEHLKDIERRIHYLSKPVLEEGVLVKNRFGRYAFPSGYELTSGSVCEILYQPERGEPYWILTRIEHNGEDYYAVALGKGETLYGKRARIR